jgi:hypothetical protein
MNQLVVFSRDPGPTERLIAVIERLQMPPNRSEADGFRKLRDEFQSTCGGVTIVSRPPGLEFWRDAGFSPAMWSGQSDAAAVELLRDSSACMIMTGTSAADEPTDWSLWRAAHRLGIPSHVVLDQRLAIARRFVDASGQALYPDFVYVADADFAAEVVKVGVPRQTVRVLGDFHVERLRRLMNSVSESEISALRREWGVPPGTRVVLFASENVREMTRGINPAYDEIGELERLIEALRNGGFSPLAGVDPRAICLVVRPHPRDTPGKYDCYAADRTRGLNIVVSEAGPMQTVLKAADIFVGMNSSLLQFAHMCGRPTVSLTRHPLGYEPGAAR